MFIGTVLANTIGEIIDRYYKEAGGGIVNKAPSTLNRGEGTESEFFIQKIDLCGSTAFLKRRSPQTYLKIAHTFLSSVDEITRYFGADTNQAEYAGDSVIAYFKASEVTPISVLLSAYYSQLASLEMQSLDSTLNQYHFKTRTVIHYGKLILSKIGPWGDSRISAIGYELHRVCKLEKEIGDGQGRATKEFWAKLINNRPEISLCEHYYQTSPYRLAVITAIISSSTFYTWIGSDRSCEHAF